MINGSLTHMAGEMQVVKLFRELVNIHVNGTHVIVCVGMQYAIFLWYDSSWLLVLEKNLATRLVAFRWVFALYRTCGANDMDLSLYLSYWHT